MLSVLTHAARSRPEGIGIGDIAGPIVSLFVLTAAMAWVVVAVLSIGAGWVTTPPYRLIRPFVAWRRSSVHRGEAGRTGRRPPPW